MQKPKVLVIGGTGKIGSHVTSHLVRQGRPLRIFTRGQTALTMASSHFETVIGDLSDPGKLAVALRGIESVFLLWPFLTSEGAAEVIAAISVHARRVVYLSTLRAGEEANGVSNPIAHVHYEVEQLIEQSTLDWTFLRPSGFASNLALWADQIRQGDVVRWPFAGASRSLLHDTDLAEVAVKALMEDGHAGKKYLLTGTESITQTEQVGRIGIALGRRLALEEIDPDVVRQQMVGWGMPASFAMAFSPTWVPVSRVLRQSTTISPHFSVGPLGYSTSGFAQMPISSKLHNLLHLYRDRCQSSKFQYFSMFGLLDSLVRKTIKLWLYG